MSELIHLAGPDITWDGRYLRQRCAWCGAVLIDFDLARVAAPVGQDPKPAVWPVLAMVAVDGNLAYVVEYTEGEPAPTGSCMELDPAVTG